MSVRTSSVDGALRVVSVFVTAEARHGNLLAIALPDVAVRVHDRRALVEALDYPEVVFVESLHSGDLRIHGHGGGEMAFAGHPLVGAGWLLAREGAPTRILRPPAGDVPTWSDELGLQWIAAPADWGPEVTLIEHESAAAVRALTGGPLGVEFAYCWAWKDRTRTAVQARAFAPALGVAEDEATGGAAIRLTAQLDRPLVIEQGAGSVLYTAPSDGGKVELGGRVVDV